jgi:hypothetical protein
VSYVVALIIRNGARGDKREPGANKGVVSAILRRSVTSVTRFLRIAKPLFISITAAEEQQV